MTSRELRYLFWDSIHIGMVFFNIFCAYLTFKLTIFLFPYFSIVIKEPGLSHNALKFLARFQGEWLMFYSIFSLGSSILLLLLYKKKSRKWFLGTALTIAIPSCTWIIWKGANWGFGLKTFSCLLFVNLVVVSLSVYYLLLYVFRKWLSPSKDFEQKLEKTHLYLIENPSSYFIGAALFLILSCSVLISLNLPIVEDLAQGIYVFLFIGVGIQCGEVFFARKIPENKT